ncbi:MAG: RND transporter [Cyclobacteriaceae bacterium]|nr:MAG: RND transporter [Cyclobacteriaceae bacterium]
MNKIANGLSAVITPLIFKYSGLVIMVFFILATLGMFYVSRHLGVNSNTAEMFDESLEFRKSRDRYKELFPFSEDNIVIVVSGSLPELISATADSIAERLQLHPDIFASVFQPAGDPYLKKNQLLFLDTAALSKVAVQVAKARPMMSFMSENYSLRGLFSFLGLMTRFSSPVQLENMGSMYRKMDSVLLSNAAVDTVVMSWQLLMSNEPGIHQQHYNFVQVTPVLDYESVRPAKKAVETIRSVTGPYNNSLVKVRITGKKAMTYEEMGSVMDGAIQASLLALIMVSMVLWLGLRSFRLIAASLLTLLIGLILTAAFSAWAVGQLNMISVAFAVLYIGLGIDYAIHLCLRYRELGLTGSAMQVALTESIKYIAPALLLSTLSTAIGFYAFVPTEFTGVSELGLIAGTGMFISLLVTLTLLPCLIWRMSGLSGTGHRAFTSVTKGPELEMFRPQIRYTTILLSIVAVVVLTRVKFDPDPINLRDPDSESVATVRELMRTGSFTPWSLNVLTRDSAQLEMLTTQLKTVPGVERVLNVGSFLPKNQNFKLVIADSLQKKMQGLSRMAHQFEAVPIADQLKSIEVFCSLLNSPNYQSIPAIREFGRHLHQFKDSIGNLDPPMQLKSVLKLQFGLLYTLPYTVNLLLNSNPGVVKYQDLPVSIKQRWVSENGDYRIQIFPKSEIQSNRQLRDFINKVHQIAPQASGDLTVTLASGDSVVKAFKQAIVYALIAIFLMLLLYLRSIRDTVYILLPLLLAGVFTGAATVVLGLDFNFANIIAIPVLLGLGVDNGVHIVHRAGAGLDNKPLLQTSTARAILFSSLTTLFSFGNLAFSPHRGTASMGLLLTIGVVFVLITTLLVLPAFLDKSPHSSSVESADNT